MTTSYELLTTNYSVQGAEAPAGGRFWPTRCGRVRIRILILVLILILIPILILILIRILILILILIMIIMKTIVTEAPAAGGFAHEVR